MTSIELRKKFTDFFSRKSHEIMDSAPMVVKDDPTLMFTNAGMNQFKDIFLGNSNIKYNRVANTQKCLRVSGKHNDLEEVGHDTYHHTMFEMLGNWSFGNYFKEEAITWAWEFLVDVLKISPERLYATVFEGSKDDGLNKDTEAYNHWKNHLPEDRIINGSKKDNFWEMGNTGPCGPCSEIHIDLRDEKERDTKDGKELVNKDHPLVIEIWNLVFIQYNRKSDGSLELLPKKHVDTGMGFERLCMVVQGKNSNYDIDIFQSIIAEITNITNIKYGTKKDTDIALRVVSDHLRAIAFAIADGQLPSNTKAGYVIRRILRRAVRYGYTYLKQDTPFIYNLVDILAETMGDVFPELVKQKGLIKKVIKEEEASFLRTLATGIKMLDTLVDKCEKEDRKEISGKDAFILYDTYGFPLDLTQLILKEKGLGLDVNEYNSELEIQKNRSRNATKIDTEDWIIVRDDDVEEFVGNDYLNTEVKIVKYRKVKSKKKDLYQLVFNITPFYAESGGQVGDKGYIDTGKDKISILDTIRENNLTIHITEKLPDDPEKTLIAIVNETKRTSTANNHTATHLLHYALREILGKHVEQKGSLVHPDYLRFDFSHFQKVNNEELQKIEDLVNFHIRQNLPLNEVKNISYKNALEMGAIALFGEKYGDLVRVIQFGDSVELCGGTHVKSTGQIGFFKILSESAISAGIRRIEAITALKAQDYIKTQLHAFNTIKQLLNDSKNPVGSLQKLINENELLRKEVEAFAKLKQKEVKKKLKDEIKKVGDINVISGIIDIDSADGMRDLAFQLKNEIDNLYLVIGADIKGKPGLLIMISDNLVKNNRLNASNIIREAAKEIQGGGGGQAFFATAGGKKVEGLSDSIKKAISHIE